jgi:uncharacterized membrane protein YedE/YeeE
MSLVTAFIVGIIFALGLGIGGMTDPRRVIGFLDPAGNWDPSLAFVMGGALLTTFIGYRYAHAGSAFVKPAETRLTAQLIGGSALFGIGWGLSGYCPGPAIVSVAGGRLPVFVFVGAMIIGLLLPPGRGRSLEEE